jgi:hypothetical protein
MKSTIGMMIIALFAAIAGVFRFSGRRESMHNALSDGTHETGRRTFVAEAAFTTRHLLCQKGTADSGIILNVANSLPWGVVQDEPAIGDRASVALLGVTPGTLKVVGSKAIAIGAKCFTAAGGKVSDTHSSGARFIGRAVTACGGDGDEFELAHCLPMLDASGTTL